MDLGMDIKAIRYDKELGVIALAVVFGFCGAAPNDLFFATLSMLAFTLIRWCFFSFGDLSQRQWWFAQVIVPAMVLIYLARSYLSIS